MDNFKNVLICAGKLMLYRIKCSEDRHVLLLKKNKIMKCLIDVSEEMIFGASNNDVNVGPRTADATLSCVMKKVKHS